MLVHDNLRKIDSSDHVLPRSGRSIGNLLVEEGKLRPDQVKQIMDLQESHGLRFGEAAMRLGLITEEDLSGVVANQYGIPRLLPGHTPSSELVAVYASDHRRTEELRALRTQLLIRWLNPQGWHRALAIVSAQRGDGRSYIAANLAVVFAQLGKRVLLIDADMRAPRQHKIFAASDRTGLSAVLSDRADFDAVLPMPGILGLYLLPAGAPPPNPQELLSHNAFALLLKDAQARFDLVLIDTPPAMLYADAQNVAYRAGNAIVLARKNHTRAVESSAVIRGLNDAGAQIHGTVLNNC